MGSPSAHSLSPHHLLLRLLLMVAVCGATDASFHTDNCHTLQEEVTLHKETLQDLGNGRRLRLMCSTRISINKCEGYCTSRVSPSVVQYPGFKKDCHCCRENSLRNRIVTLAQCYDGSRYMAGQFTTMLIKEPVDCACSNCEL